MGAVHERLSVLHNPSWADDAMSGALSTRERTVPKLFRKLSTQGPQW